MSRTDDISRERGRVDAWYPPFAPLPAQTRTVSHVGAEPPWLGDTPATTTRRRPTRTLAAATLTVIAAGAIAVIATNPKPTDRVSIAPQPTAAESWCPAATDGDTVTGNGPGGQQDGASAILAFDYAYYVLRSGEQARAVVAPDAVTVSSAQVIQAAIDQAIPPGTEHCLTIVTDSQEQEVERYWVTLTERRPDSGQETYKQTVTTADQGGRYVITSIGAAE